MAVSRLMLLPLADLHVAFEQITGNDEMLDIILSLGLIFARPNIWCFLWICYNIHNAWL